MNAKKICWEQEITEEDFTEYLNDNYPHVDICGMEMNQGDILFECDNIAFREAYNNHLDAEEREQGSFECGECEQKYDDIIDAETCCKDEE